MEYCQVYFPRGVKSNQRFHNDDTGSVYSIEIEIKNEGIPVLVQTQLHRSVTWLDVGRWFLLPV